MAQFVEPGVGYGGYIELSDITAKGRMIFRDFIIELRKNSVFLNGKPIQGITVSIPDKLAIIKGTHYTSWEAATQIRLTNEFAPSQADPFVYIAEPGKMTGWSEAAIKRELNAAAANTEVNVKVAVPIKRVWIKVLRYTAHFAIRGVVSGNDILELSIQRHK